MRFVRYDQSRLGLLTEDETGIVDLTDRLDLSGPDPLAAYLRRDLDAAPYADADADRAVADVDLAAPIRRPGKVVAAPGNYAEHIGEVDPELVDPDERSTVDDLYYFLKAPSSVTGPGSTIVLPFNDRRFDHEIELAFVVADDVADVSPEEAWDHVFGYTILLDISLRGTFDRSNRKSYDTFTPVGPAVVTPEDVGDPQSLDMELSVNGDVRQSATTAQMIHTCAEVLSYASISTTVEAGDLVTTGTPEGVDRLADGDELTATIENVGTMSLDVRERDRRYEDMTL